MSKTDVLQTRPKQAGSAPFKLGMRTLVSGVSIITAHGAGGAPLGLTATSVSSLAADPPSLLVCVNRQKEIAAALAPGAPFAVNVLTDKQVLIAQSFGGQLSARGADRFAHGTWHRSADGEVPLLLGCRVAFECRVSHVHDWETHHIVIGSVVDVHFFAPDEPPLAYCDGTYRSVGPLSSSE